MSALSHPSVDEISEAAAGRGLPDHREHLTKCPSCIRLISAIDGDTPNRSPAACRDFESALDDLVAGRIARGECHPLDRHLADCRDCKVLAVRPPPPDHPLQCIPQNAYLLEDRIDQGGMGRLYRARDRRLGREVALKELLDPAMARRFEQEARLTARLQHPAVVSVIEAGRWPDGSAFYTMDLVVGERLDEKIARCRNLDDRLALLPAVVTVAEALAYAHEKRIVHRDVKPRNVMVGDYGESVLLDWGIAKDLREAEEPGASDLVDRPTDGGTHMGIGTPPYMPPEQAAGEPATERMDVYALGATLYHLFAGQPPYPISCTRRHVIEAPPEPLEAVAPRDTPRSLQSIVAKAMARDPVERFTNAKQLAQELVRFQTDRLVRSHRYSFVDRARFGWRRYRSRIRGREAIAVVVVLSVLALGGLGSLVRMVIEKNRVKHTAATLLLEHGRFEIDRGDPARALAYLVEAQRLSADEAELRRLIAAAGEIDARQVTTFEGLRAHARTLPWRVKEGRLVPRKK